MKRICDNCGKLRNVKQVRKGIWNFGVRTVKVLTLCKRCEGM